MKRKYRRFMRGRNGFDDYSKFLVGLGFVLELSNLFLRNVFLSALCWAVLLYICFRIFSRNTNRRYQENQKYLGYIGKITGGFHRSKEEKAERKKFHIYTCPSCGQKIRIPRGKGKVEVRCPKCSHTFVKRS